LISDLVLTLFNPDLEIRLYTDTSCLGVAGILIQVNSKKENVISYFSKHTTANERKFHSFELKALAIVSSVRRFRQYLLGRSFTIVTDCAAVRNAFSKGEVNARIGRWVLELSEYRFTIVRRSNLQMRHVDALSRNLPCYVINYAPETGQPCYRLQIRNVQGYNEQVVASTRFTMRTTRNAD
jgi:hypothetical protein